MTYFDYITAHTRQSHIFNKRNICNFASFSCVIMLQCRLRIPKNPQPHTPTMNQILVQSRNSIFAILEVQAYILVFVKNCGLWVVVSKSIRIVASQLQHTLSENLIFTFMQKHTNANQNHIKYKIIVVRRTFLVFLKTSKKILLNINNNRFGIRRAFHRNSITIELYFHLPLRRLRSKLINQRIIII